MWTFVAYMRVSGIGIASSSSRYIAKYISENRMDDLKSTVATVFYLQLCISAFVFTCTILLAVYIPSIFHDRLGDHVSETSTIMLFLGGSLVHFFIFDIFRGVVTGRHRWDIHNLIISLNHLATFIAMIAVLMLGGGLVELSIVYFSVTLLFEFVLLIFAYNILPEISISYIYFSKKRAVELVKFGLKTTLITLPNLLVLQSSNLLVVSLLGPAKLALMSRPIALLKHIEAFISKYTFVLTPMAGSMQSKGNKRELQDFLINSTFYSVSFTLPVVIFMAVFGDSILFLWMGEGFDDLLLVSLLSIGLFLPISQGSAQRILVGLNAHGKIAIINIFSAIVLFMLIYFINGVIGWSIYSAVFLIIIPLMVSQGIILPVYACLLLELSIFEYVRKVFTKPLICGVIYLGILVLMKTYLPFSVITSLLVGGLIGGLVLAVLYWYCIASIEFKMKLMVYFE